MFPILTIARTISVLVILAPEPDSPHTRLSNTCEALFGPPHKMTIRVEQVDATAANIVFFEAGPGYRVLGTLMREGTPTDFTVSIAIPKSQLSPESLSPGALLTLDVQIYAAKQLADQTVLSGTATMAPPKVRVAPPPSNSNDAAEPPGDANDDVNKTPPVQKPTEAPLTPEKEEGLVPEEESTGEAANESDHSDAPVSGANSDKKLPMLESVLRNWERDVVVCLKNDRPVIPPPEIADRRFQCTLRSPSGVGLTPTIACSVFSARSLSQKDVLTPRELSNLVSAQADLEHRLFQSKHNLYRRKDSAYQRRIRELRQEGREILAEADRRIAEAIHRVILSNPNALAGARGRKAIKCVLAVSAVEVEERGRLPVLIITGEVID